RLCVPDRNQGVLELHREARQADAHLHVEQPHRQRQRRLDHRPEAHRKRDTDQHGDRQQAGAWRSEQEQQHRGPKLAGHAVGTAAAASHGGPATGIRRRIMPTDWLSAPDYTISRLLIGRGLAAIYLIGFLVAVRQFRPLLGERGLLPVPRFVAAVPFMSAPSLFQWHYSDRALGIVAWSGAAIAALMLLGLPQAVSLPLTMLAWILLWALYLSIVNVGQTFYAFGWED